MFQYGDLILLPTWRLLGRSTPLGGCLGVAPTSCIKARVRPVVLKNVRVWPFRASNLIASRCYPAFGIPEETSIRVLDSHSAMILTKAQRDYFLGIALLGLVVVIWVGSNKVITVRLFFVCVCCETPRVPFVSQQGLVGV